MFESRALDVLVEFKSREAGLSDNEARERLEKYGRNSIKKADRFGFFKIMGHQFTDLMVIILLVAGTLAFIFSSFRDAGIMFLIVAINASIGFFQEFKVEKTLSALSRLLPKKVRAIRHHQEKEILAEMVVPGDLITVSTGEDVPADAIIIESYGLKTDESTLTGESHPVDKEAVTSNPKITDTERLFMGTTVLEGSAKAVIDKTGFNTRFGKIANQTSGIKTAYSPLQKKLNQMSRLVARVAIIILAVVITYGVFTGKDLVSNFLFALALAAAVVPEGLPATVSVALSIAAGRLARKKALIKKLTSTESLGAATVICTDKTGTVTLGRMEVKAFWSLSQNEVEIEKLDHEKFEILINTFVLCSHAGYTGHKISGNYNEISLLEYLIKKKINFEKIRKADKVIHEIPFTSGRKMMSVVAKIGDEHWLLTKGLPERVLEKCKVTPLEKEKITEAANSFSERALHNLTFAYRKLSSNFQPPKNPSGEELKKFNEELESGLTFLGILGLADPLKEGVVEAVAKCHQAGIRIVMITGDSDKTALAISREMNFFPDNIEYNFTGTELDAMTDIELRHKLQKNLIFAEVDPEHKLRVVENLQAMGEIVAVTGDGVNDAPALKKADIGISMGHKGTDVAKEAADMILLDDNFATIVRAIYEGRSIFENIQKIVYYVFASNAGELLTVVFGVLLRIPLPIIAVQILAIDLGTDVLPSLALAFDKGGKDLMGKPAEHKGVLLLDRKNLLKLFITGLVMGGGATLSFYLLTRAGYSYAVATTASYTTIVLCQIVSVLMTHLNFRGSIFIKQVFDNRYLILAEIFSMGLLLAIIYLKPFQYILQTSSLMALGWVIPILSALVLLIIGQKFFMKKEMV